MSAAFRQVRTSARAAGFVLLALACVLAAAVAMHEPLSASEPVFMADVVHWSPATPIADTFVPLAYPLLLAPAFRAAGVHGIVAVQAALFVATVGVAYLLFLLAELPVRIAGLGALLVLVDPELFLSIAKVWDVGLSTFLFLLLTLGCVYAQRVGAAAWLWPALGVVFGAALFCRPNFAVLVPVVLYAVWTGAGRVSTARIAGFALVAGLLATGTFVVAGVAAHGAPFVPRNGPYNLYAGNNPLSRQFLLEKLNAEPSLVPALRAAHPELIPAGAVNDFYFSAGLELVYRRDALRFILQHPGEECRLIAIKLFTLMRPDTKVHPLRSGAGAGKAVVALPALLWMIALLLPGRPALTRVDWMLLGFAAAYVLPFLLTNSDPRFRTPLDPLLLLMAFRLLFRRQAVVASDAS